MMDGVVIAVAVSGSTVLAFVQWWSWRQEEREKHWKARMVAWRDRQPPLGGSR